MDQVTIRDLADIVMVDAAAAAATATAGGSGDNTARTGVTLDRNNYGVPLGGLFIIGYTATLAQAATLTIKTCKIEHSPDASTWTTYQTFTDPGVVSTGGTGGTTNEGAVKLQADLKSAYRYVRLDYTPDLSASGADTLKDQAVVVFHGQDRLPPQATAA